VHSGSILGEHSGHFLFPSQLFPVSGKMFCYCIVSYNSVIIVAINSYKIANARSNKNEMDFEINK